MLELMDYIDELREDLHEMEYHKEIEKVVEEYLDRVFEWASTHGN